MGMEGMGQVEVQPYSGATWEAPSRSAGRCRAGNSVNGTAFWWMELSFALGAVDGVRVSVAAGGIAAGVTVTNEDEKLRSLRFVAGHLQGETRLRSVSALDEALCQCGET